jgi:hypothetical protein
MGEPPGVRHQGAHNRTALHPPSRVPDSADFYPNFYPKRSCSGSEMLYHLIAVVIGVTNQSTSAAFGTADPLGCSDGVKNDIVLTPPGEVEPHGQLHRVFSCVID